MHTHTVNFKPANLLCYIHKNKSSGIALTLQLFTTKVLLSSKDCYNTHQATILIFHWKQCDYDSISKRNLAHFCEYWRIILSVFCCSLFFSLQTRSFQEIVLCMVVWILSFSILGPSVKENNYGWNR